MKLQDIASDTLEWQIVSIKPDKDLVREIQHGLTAKGFNPGAVNGVWGTTTQTAYTAFAKANQFRADELTPKTARLLLQKSAGTATAPKPTTPITSFPQPTPSSSTGGQASQPPIEKPINKKLTASDYAVVARIIGCEVATVRAVVQVESSGAGFLADGRPKILFEAQWFGYFTGDRYNQTHPDISSLTWNSDLYVGGAGEWTRLEKAAVLDRTAALKSASWGLGQVMGFNFNQAGYADIESFVKDMHVSEGKQLMAMFNFINSNGLGRYLRDRDWARFARAYNGEGYRQNRYDEKLATAYQHWSTVV